MATEEKIEEVTASSPELDHSPSKECDLEGCIEDTTEAELTCKICQEELKNPKILSCFDTFCQDCLEQKVLTDSETIDGEPIKPVETVTCPVCEQRTPLPNGKVENLMGNFPLEDRMNPSSENTVIICSSCKAKEKAVAHCAKCPNFLCNNCMAAHQFMRCFDDHVVESFEDIIKNGGTIAHQKPVLCRKHAEENLVSFCNTCQVAVCQKCIVQEHVLPEHQCVSLSEVDGSTTEGLKALVSKGRKQLQTSCEVSLSLTNYLTELEEQRVSAHTQIIKTFENFKACVEKKKEKFLAELGKKHSMMEMTHMESNHTRELYEMRLANVCNFIEKLLNGEGAAYLPVYKNMAETQLMSLMNTQLKTSISGTIEFKSDVSVFENVVTQTFGCWNNEETKMSPVQPSFESKPTFSSMAVVPSMIAAEQLVGHVATDAEFLAPSLPTMSNVSQLAALSSTFDSLPPMASVASLASAPPIPPLDPVSRTSLSPAMSDSGISMESNSNNSATMMNIAAMAKLTSVGLNGQAIMGSPLTEVNTSAAGSVGSGSTSRTQTPMGQGTDGIQGMLAVSPTQQVQTDNLEQLASLLHSQPPPPSLPFNTMPTMEMPAVTVGGSAGSSADIGNPSLGSPTGSTFSGATTTAPYPPVRRPSKMSAMQIRCKFGQLGPGKCQFNSPHGFCLGIEQDIIVADTNNHRIQVFEKTGEFKTQFGIPGREEGQLWYPRKVAVMRPSGKFVVCDRGNERSHMQIFTRNGHFLKKIAIRYIDIVAGLAITASGNIVAVDSVSPTVFVISEGGELVKWFDCSDYMREPSDIAVSNREYFVCDFKGHCVVVFNEDGSFLRRIGCENITNYPNGIDISDAGDVLIGDSHGNRFHVAVFQRDGSLIGEFQCPYVKVSRCCGLKITSEGYIVTLAKNNHHVLVLNTLYIV
ncbi:protein meiotic P26-like [Babylonia areolata]|uniref:protein meiotic P26-like n=1 Tax=Babylonia areolata TaxID=304850 RepID=UPI003FD08713